MSGAATRHFYERKIDRFCGPGRAVGRLCVRVCVCVRGLCRTVIFEFSVAVVR